MIPTSPYARRSGGVLEYRVRLGGGTVPTCEVAAATFGPSWRLRRAEGSARVRGRLALCLPRPFAYLVALWYCRETFRPNSGCNEQFGTHRSLPEPQVVGAPQRSRDHPTSRRYCSCVEAAEWSGGSYQLDFDFGTREKCCRPRYVSLPLPPAAEWASECRRIGEARHPGPVYTVTGLDGMEVDEGLDDAELPRRDQGGGMLAAFGGKWDEKVAGMVRAKALLRATAEVGRSIMSRGVEARLVDIPGVTCDMSELDMAKEDKIVVPAIGHKVTMVERARSTSAVCGRAPSVPACEYGVGTDWRQACPDARASPTRHGQQRRRGTRLRHGHRGGAHRHRFAKRMLREELGSVGSATSIYFANVTSWSEHAQSHVYEKIKSDVAIVAETHKDKGHVEELRKTARRQGYESTIAPAARSDNSDSGTHGGLLALARVDRRSAPLSSCNGPLGATIDSSNIVGREVWLDEVLVLVLGCYMECGGGLEGFNLGLLQEVEELTRSGARLFVLVGDFNTPPEAWCAGREGWLSRNDAAILTPDNTPFTCRTNSTETGGSLIDYAIVSSKLLPLVRRVWADLDAPWGPHYGIHLELRGRLKEVMVDRLVRNTVHAPKGSGAAPPGGETSVGNDEVRIDEFGSHRGGVCDEGITDDEGWAKEFRAAAREALNRGDSEGELARAARDFAEQVGILQSAERIGGNLAVWSRALQRCVRRKEGGGTDEAAGSGTRWRQLPEVRRVPLFPKRPRQRFVDGAGGGSAHTRWWRTLARRLGDTARWSTRGAERCTALLGLKEKLEHFLGGEDSLAEDALGHISDDDRWLILGECNLALEAISARAQYDAAEAMKVLDRLAADAARRSKRIGLERFKRWIKDSLRGGGKEAHRWSNAANALPALRLALRDRSGERYITDPIEVATEHRRPWAEEWEAGNAQLWAKELQAMEAVRRRCSEEARTWADSVDLSPAAIRRACRTFASSTAIGIDDLELRLIARVPDMGLEMLGCLVRDIMANLALPLQSLVNILTLLGKKCGGSRTIAIMPSVYRLTMRLAGTAITEWDVKTASMLDSAVRGSSSLRAHLGRALGMELARSEGKTSFHFLWDLKKFYDTVRLDVLHERLGAYGYNLPLLYLGFLAHKAPRTLKVGHCMSGVIANTGRSMIAGCQQSVSWARGLLLRLVMAVSDVVPSSPCGVHVDDLSHVVCLDDDDAVAIKKGLEIGRKVAQEVADLDLRLSDKSVLVPASSRVVREIVSGLRSEGIKIRAANTGDDVGVATTGGTRRCAATLNARIKRARARAQRVGYLCTKVKSAAKLGRTGVQPMQQYGHQACGASRRQVDAMRRNLKMASHMGPTRGCLSTTIRWIHGEGADPLVTMRLEQFEAWFDLWEKADTVERRRIRKHWVRVMPTLVAAEDRWSKSNGPAAGIICALVEMGWRPAAPDRWRSPRGMMAMVGCTPYADALIREELRRDLEACAAKEAEAHHDSSGIGDRILLGPARAAKRFFVKAGRWREAAAVDHLVCGTLWDPQPRSDGSYCAEAYCNRCGKRRIATRKHTLWLCDANERIPDPIITESAHLVKMALENWDKERCLWARGILPNELGQPMPPIAWEDLRTWAVGDFGKVADDDGDVYTDGAGPRGRISRPGSRVFAGAVAVRHERRHGVTYIGDYGVVCGQVPGRQTVPRAEVWGLVLAVAFARSAPSLRIGVDASYAIAGFGRENLVRRGDNGDLWCKLFQLIDQRRGSIAFKKVEAHTADKDLDTVVRKEPLFGDAIGNAMADRAALLGRQLASCDDEDIEWSYLYARTVKVMKRLAVVQAEEWKARDDAKIYEHRPPPAVVVPELSTAVDDLIRSLNAAGHRIEKIGDRFVCNRCRKGRLSLKLWRRIPCLPRLSAAQLVARHRLCARALALTGRGATTAGLAGSHEETRADTGADDAVPPAVAEATIDAADEVMALPSPAAELEQQAAGTDVEPFARARGSDWNAAFGEDGPLFVPETTSASQEARDPAAQPFLEPPAWTDGPLGEAAEEGERRVRRRLNSKTRPAEADEGFEVTVAAGGDSGLLTRREAKAESARNAAKRRRLQQERAAVEDLAERFVERRPHLLDGGVGEAAEPGVPHLAANPGFHESHDVTLSRATGVAYCRVCAAWTRGLRTRLLKAPCAGECRQKSLLRRLELGAEPCNGRIPSELKRPGSRGSRGGR